MLHDNRDRVRQRVEIPPQSPELAANTHRRNRAIEFLQSRGGSSAVQSACQRVASRPGPMAAHRSMLTRVQRTCLRPRVIEASQRRAAQRPAFRRSGDALAFSILAVPTRACAPEVVFIPDLATRLAAPVRSCRDDFGERSDRLRVAERTSVGSMCWLFGGH
jgi:hypothetical protein